MQHVDDDEVPQKAWQVRLVELSLLEDTLNDLTGTGYMIYSIETVEAFPNMLKEVIAHLPIEYVSMCDDEGSGEND